MKTLIESAIEHLENENYKYSKAEGHDVIYLNFVGRKVRVQLTIRADESHRYLFVRADSGFVIPEERRDQMTRFICGANFGLRTGAFQLDHNDGEMFFQTGLFASHREELPTDMVEDLVNAASQTYRRYYDGIINVCFKDADGETAAKCCDNAPLAESSISPASVNEMFERLVSGMDEPSLSKEGSAEEGEDTGEESTTPQRRKRGRPRKQRHDGEEGMTV